VCSGLVKIASFVGEQESKEDGRVVRKQLADLEGVALSPSEMRERCEFLESIGAFFVVKKTDLQLTFHAFEKLCMELAKKVGGKTFSKGLDRQEAKATFKFGLTHLYPMIEEYNKVLKLLTCMGDRHGSDNMWTTSFLKETFWHLYQALNAIDQWWKRGVLFFLESQHVFPESYHVFS